jgi:hypothetical protein
MSSLTYHVLAVMEKEENHYNFRCHGICVRNMKGGTQNMIRWPNKMYGRVNRNEGMEGDNDTKGLKHTKQQMIPH